MAGLLSSYLLLPFLFTLTVNHGLASLLLEDGYTVTTLVNGDKIHVNPFFVLPLFGSSDLIVLDSARSTFYTLSFASSQEGAVKMKKLAGNGVAGYADGELGSAMFNKPKSFAVDYKGNVYVADRLKHTVRKISESGVSTIAGGYAQATGNKDGPAQNASFSDDFELAFVPERCAIMISDRGNRLVREMKLKTEDCSRGSQSGVGMSYFWAIGLGLSCLLGMIVGFVGRPYVISRGGSRLLTCSKTWNHCLISLEKQVVMLFFVIRSVIASSTLYLFLTRLVSMSLSIVYLILRIRRVEPRTFCNNQASLLDSDYSQTFRKNPPSLLDSDYSETFCKSLPSLLDCDKSMSDKMTKSQLDPLKDLMSCDDVVVSSSDAKTNVEKEETDKKRIDVSAGRDEKIEYLIEANMLGFVEQARTTLLDESLDHCSGLVKRKGSSLPLLM